MGIDIFMVIIICIKLLAIYRLLYDDDDDCIAITIMSKGSVFNS